MSKRLISICSARPNFVKLAAVHHALVNHPDIEHQIVHTGQHYDPLFSDVFFEQLAIPLPDHNLGIHGGTREEVIDRTHQALLPLFREQQPTAVLVYGDVNGAVGAARAAVELQLPVVHVEAGLRSFDTDMPEEVNRIEIDQKAALLLCSEQAGMDNLANEDSQAQRVLVGNTMIDTLIRMRPLIDQADFPADLPATFGVVTMHRPSNVDTKEAFQANLAFLAEVAAECPLVLPVHHRFKAGLEKFDLHDQVPEQLTLIDALGYVPFLRLVTASAFILTDSGGLQEEATFLHKRCFTLRLNTERPSTIDSGSNTLINRDEPADRAQVITYAKELQETTISPPSLWDGQAGERIITAIQDHLRP